ncbi:MAG TPA: energy transducer TonB [Chryseosolibacter sp.]
MDYEFPLEYTDRHCADEHVPLNIELSLESSDIPGYTPPEIDGGEPSLRSFILRNLRYPAHARRRGIQGMVHLIFDITKEGKIENVAVKKGVHVVLDKEAVRLIRKLKLASPALINGQPKDFCVTMPLWFKLS